MSKSERAAKCLQVIETTIERIFSRSISEYSFQTLHDAGYFLVQNGFGGTLFEKVSTLFDRKTTNIFTNVTSLDDDQLLDELVCAWKEFSVSVSQSSDFLIFFNRHFCAQLRRSTVREIGCSSFLVNVLSDEAFLSRISSVFVRTLPLCWHDRERRSVLLELSNVSHFLSPSLFEERIFGPFVGSLADTEREIARKLSFDADLSSFVKEFCNRVSEHKDHCISIVGERGWPRVESMLQNTWLIENKHQLLSREAVSNLLRQKKFSELRSVFVTFQTVGEDETIIGLVKQFITSEAQRIVDDASRSPPSIAQEFILLHKLVCKVKEDCCSKKSETLLKTFEDNLNRNTGISSALARLADDAVSRSSHEAFDDTLNELVGLFKCLRDKDMFEMAYKQLVARRLLVTCCEVGRSSNDDSAENRERMLSSRLQKEVGGSLLTKVEGMLTDARMMDEQCESFSQELTSLSDLRVLVATAGLWPPFPPCSISLRSVPELEVMAEKFHSLYTKRHQGRRLEFVVSEGMCEVRLNIVGNTRRIDVHMPTFCVPFLFLFETVDETLTASQVSNKIDCHLSEASRALQVLTRGGSSGLFTPLLTRSEGQEFGWNKDFRSKSLKIRLCYSLHHVTEPSNQTERAVSVVDNRRFRIDAAIVRVMKSRRLLDHHSLVAEIIHALSSSFAPSHEDIKRRIEYLIEREYIARVADRQGLYSYIA